MTEDLKEDIKEETVEPIDVIIKNHPKEKDNTSWDTIDEWDIINMTEEDIKQAEESRNA